MPDKNVSSQIWLVFQNVSFKFSGSSKYVCLSIKLATNLSVFLKMENKKFGHSNWIWKLLASQLPNHHILFFSNQIYFEIPVSLREWGTTRTVNTPYGLFVQKLFALNSWKMLIRCMSRQHKTIFEFWLDNLRSLLKYKSTSSNFCNKI